MTPAEAVHVEVVRHADADYTVATVDLRGADLDLYGDVGGLDLATLRTKLADVGRDLVVATNAGMFSPGYVPVGLFVGKGPPTVAGARPGPGHAIDLGGGGGNFYLKPNGVFWIDADGAHVARSEAYEPHGDVRLATQSGPLLLEDGKVHPAFRPQSSNYAIRSGVCAKDASTVELAISSTGVRFYDFATLFRDELGCKDALYLDGAISILSTPDEPLTTSATFGGILAVTVPTVPAVGK